MINVRIVEFEDGRFGVVELRRDWLMRLVPGEDFYDLRDLTNRTWSAENLVEKYCKGSYEEAVAVYLKLVERDLVARKDQLSAKIKRMI